MAADVDSTTRQGSVACGKLLMRPQLVRCTEWASDTCPLAWSVRAIWRPRDKFAHIAAVARSAYADVVAVGYKSSKLNLGVVQDAMSAKEEAAAKHNLMASRLLGPAAKLNVFREVPGAAHRLGVLDGPFPHEGITKLSIDRYSAAVLDVHTVKLFRYPAVGVPSSAFMRDSYMTGSAGTPGAGPATRPAWYEAFPRAYRGHASKAANVAFSADDLWLLTTGGTDCAVFQWRHTRPLYLRWWVARNERQQAALRDRFARVIPRVMSESTAQQGNMPTVRPVVLEGGAIGLPERARAGPAQWQSEAHYIFACYQRALLSIVGMGLAEDAAAPRGDVLRRLEEREAAIVELLALAFDTPAEMRRAQAGVSAAGAGGSRGGGGGSTQGKQGWGGKLGHLQHVKATLAANAREKLCSRLGLSLSLALALALSCSRSLPLLSFSPSLSLSPSPSPTPSPPLSPLSLSLSLSLSLCLCVAANARDNSCSSL